MFKLKKLIQQLLAIDFEEGMLQPIPSFFIHFH
jgi:hypothetical protein